MERFYYSRFGTDVDGPVADADLWKMVQAGILPSSVQVCREGTEEWVAISLSPAAAPAGPALEHLPPPDLSLVAAGSAIVSDEEAELVEEEEEEATEERGERVIQIINSHSYYAMGAMMIPLPGVDVGATHQVHASPVWQEGAGQSWVGRFAGTVRRL